MHIQVLGCDGGIGDPLRTCALLVNDQILLDAGTGVGELPLHKLTAIDYVFVTHAYADHIASVPLLIDAVMAHRSHPVTVHATAETLRALKAHIFNWAIWPDFTELPSPDSASMRLSELRLGETVHIAGCRIMPIQAKHTIPTVGFHVEANRASVAYCGDTTSCDSLWSTLNGIANLGCLIIETAFDDSKLRLAERTGHLCPALLAVELEKFRLPAEIYINHMKPGLGDTIMREVKRTLKGPSLQKLMRGQVLEF